MHKGLFGIIISMLTVFKHLFKTPVTLEYPERKRNVPKNFRGKPVVRGCIKCMNCIRVCPASAIKIDGDSYTIDMNRCIICGNCSYYCPVNAVKMSTEYELASKNKEDMILVYDINKREDVKNG